MNWFRAWLLTGGTNRKNSLPSLVMPKKNQVQLD